MYHVTFGYTHGFLAHSGSLAQWWLMAYWTHFTVPSSLVWVRSYVTVGYTSLFLPLWVTHVVFGHTSLFRPHWLLTWLCHIWFSSNFPQFLLSEMTVVTFWWHRSLVDSLTFPASLPQWWLWHIVYTLLFPSSLHLVMVYGTLGYTYRSVLAALAMICVTFGHTSRFRPHLH